ncbi:S-layer homology domain-containing protein, partial [Paenibacillus sp. TAF58]
MKNSKKTLAALTITATVGLSAILPINALAANPFTDSANTAQVQTAIEQLAQQQVVSGYENNSFKPNQIATRAEVSKIVALALHVSIDPAAANHFNDVTKGDWFYSYAVALETLGALKDNAGQFRGDQSISYDQLADVIANVLKVDKTAVEKLPSFTSITGSQVTRGQAALLIFEAQQLAPIQVTKLQALNAITLQVTF